MSGCMSVAWLCLMAKHSRKSIIEEEKQKEKGDENSEKINVNLNLNSVSWKGKKSLL